MQRHSAFLIAAPIFLLAGCADFPEKYENVIEDAKIRPFAIVLDPPEAAPGDTVRASLRLYDAGKSYAVRWSLALKFQIKQGVTGSSFPTATEWLDLDSAGLDRYQSADGPGLAFAIPAGSQNPLRFTGYVPELIPESGLSAEEKSALPDIGIGSFASGIKREAMLTALDSHPDLPNGLASLVDGFLAVVQIKAHVTAPGFALDVTKNLTVRYSNRLAAGGLASNVNANPRFDSIGLIHVAAGGLTDAGKIARHASDTVWFAASGRASADSSRVDTVQVDPADSYFLIASDGAAQRYRSPQGGLHREQLFYQWFYTNMDAPGKKWDELIVTVNGGRPLDGPVIPIRFPAKAAGLRRFAIRATVGDLRPEWGILSSAGLAFASFQGWIRYP